MARFEALKLNNDCFELNMNLRRSLKFDDSLEFAILPPTPISNYNTPSTKATKLVGQRKRDDRERKRDDREWKREEERKRRVDPKNS